MGKRRVQVSEEEAAVQDETYWIGEIRRGNVGQFRHLYEKYHQKLFALCYRFTGNRGDAEDQLQEVFMRLLQKIDQFRGESAFGTWAHRLATNHLLNFAGRRRDRYEDELESAPEQASQESDHHMVLALEKAVAALPEGYRKVFILHDQEGYKHEEIGEILGISPATSRSQLTRARMALREQLKPLLHQEETP